MSEEKLKEIKDSIDFQERITKEHDFDMTFLQEEIDLYNEVAKLKHENKELKNYYCKKNDCSGRLKENNKLTDSEVLTEFGKWLEEEMDKEEDCWYGSTLILADDKRQVLIEAYDKLQELKEDKK